MFLYESRTSVNTIEDMPLGVYLGRASIYELEGCDGTLIQGEFCLAGESLVIYMELLIESRKGTGYSYRDFLLLPDGYWRDSSGEKSKNVAMLHPPELLLARLIEQKDLPPVFNGSKK